MATDQLDLRKEKNSNTRRLLPMRWRTDAYRNCWEKTLLVRHHLQRDDCGVFGAACLYIKHNADASRSGAADGEFVLYGFDTGDVHGHLLGLFSISGRVRTSGQCHYAFRGLDQNG